MWQRLLGPDTKQEDDVQEDHLWQREIEREFLAVWDDAWMNRHLGYRIVELVMLRVLPEMADKGPKELMEMRLGPET